MNYQTNMQNMAALQNNACGIQGNMLGRYLNDQMNSSPQAVKKRNAHAYAAEVRARKPEMQVKRIGETA